MSAKERPSRQARGELTPSARYTAVVCGDGRILPILERLGRRHVGEIDPLSGRGRDLLASGCVTLFYDDGARAETVPVDDVLERMCALARDRRDAYPGLAQWTFHHDEVLESIARNRRRLKSGH